MIRSILYPLVEGSAESCGRQAAFSLAAQLACRLYGLAVIDVKSFEFPVLGTPDGFMPSVLTPPMQESESLLRDMKSAARHRLDEFAAECGARNIPCSAAVETGIPGEVIAREAVAHDLLILARGGTDRPEQGLRVDPLIHAVIRGSIRPVLVPGPGFRDLRRMVVAYDGSIHAARALQVAAMLGNRPDIDCVLLIVAGSAEIGQETLAPAEAYLSHHGVHARKEVILGTRPSDVICEVAQSTGADLLVMGAFGHTPIREMIFGSTTDKVLSHCGTTVILQS